MNGGYLDPKLQTLIVVARAEDVLIDRDDDGTNRLVIKVENLDEGIEVSHDEDRLWRLA